MLKLFNARLPLAVSLIAAALSLAASPQAPAATVLLYNTAIEAGLKREVFNQDGRRVLLGEPNTCSYAYVEHPQVTLRDGRLYLKVSFSVRTARTVQGSCVGAPENFDLVLSAEPFVREDVLSLRNLHLEEGGGDIYRPLLEMVLAQPLSRALNVNLKTEVARILRGNDSVYKVTVPSLQVQSLSAQGNVLTVNLEFQLEAR